MDMPEELMTDNLECSTDKGACCGNRWVGVGMSLGAGVGTALGAGIGVALGDVGFWCGIGVAGGISIGLAVGAALSICRKES